MTAGLGIWRCDRCGTRVFPERLLCPSCHGPAFTVERVEAGFVEEVATIHHMLGQENWTPRRIASVRTTGAVLVTAGLLGDAAPGDEVELIEENGAPFARVRGG